MTPKQKEKFFKNLKKFTFPILMVFFAQLALGTDLKASLLVALLAFYGASADYFSKVKQVSSQEYGFSDETKKWARNNSKGFNDGVAKDVHHIVSKYTAKKYGLDKKRIKSKENAIALERNTFHAVIHGRRLTQEDKEMEWKGFEESDYIFLAQALLGFTEEDFEKVLNKGKRGYRKKKKRR